MKTKHIFRTKNIALIVLVALLSACSDNEVGDVSLGIFTTKDIKIDSLQDPIVTGVTCHISSIEANLDLADPSDSSIACRQTGMITAQMIAQIDKSASGEIVFKKSKSIFFFSWDNTSLNMLGMKKLFVPYSSKIFFIS